jgi:lipid II isoglutaminyl synthase (glutamine-hydrolysing)
VSTESSVRIVWIYPDLLSTYGDRGNMLILARRAGLRGVAAECVEVQSDQAVPEQGDIYLLAGGEDGPQALAAERLIADGGLNRAAARGAVVFAVCAGYQLLGSSFFAKGAKCGGLSLLDLYSDRGESRAVGEVAGNVDPALGLPPLTGFENHGGRTHLGGGVKPVATVRVGIGNDGSTEGAWAGKVLGTYSHGPALARNPALADLLVHWATGADMTAVDDTWPGKLRKERLEAVGVR